METCRVIPIPGKNSVQCLTHRVEHWGKAAELATARTEKAERLRRQWDKYYGYVPAEPAAVRIETRLAVQSRPGRADRQWELTLRNFRTEDLQLYYCSESGQETLFDTLPAASEIVLQSPDGAAWAIRDTLQQLVRVIDPVGNDGIAIEVA